MLRYDSTLLINQAPFLSSPISGSGVRPQHVSVTSKFQLNLLEKNHLIKTFDEADKLVLDEEY